MLLEAPMPLVVPKSGIKQDEQALSVDLNHLLCPNCSAEDFNLNMLTVELINESGVSGFTIPPMSEQEIASFKQFLTIAPLINDQAVIFDHIPGIKITIQGLDVDDLVWTSFKADRELFELMGINQSANTVEAIVSTKSLSIIVQQLNSLSLNC